ncbi:MAG: molybdopterin molybdotransferase MoeA [Maricaulaceae bacterium]|jgi:molybdopterin molybdotransferase
MSNEGRGLIPLETARALILEHLAPLSAETVALAEADGRVLAADVIATRTQPLTATSAMDGYAVRSQDLTDRPARLTLAGESAAGHPADQPIEAGQAIRISTGASIPAGADQVVIQENASRDRHSVLLDAAPEPGAHVRPAGIDYAEGDVLLSVGARMSPFAIALAASVGALKLKVARAPRVAIISTGDELVEPGEPLSNAAIVNSNAPGLVRLIAEAGGAPDYLGIARDNEASVRDAFARAEGADLIITIGGASVGDHDHVRNVFSSLGGSLVFEKIAVKPGKPTWFGRLDGAHVLGLPGNPVSAFVVSRLLLITALARLQGDARAGASPLRPAILGGALPANGPREAYLCGAFEDDGRVRAFSKQDSAALSGLARADVLIRRPIDAPALEDGAAVEIVEL